MTRLKELEVEKQNLITGMDELRRSQRPTPDTKELGKKLSAFLLDFEARFEKVPIEEKKILVKRLISRVVIDRENRIARFYVRTLPSITPEIEALYLHENKKALTEVVSARSSGGRTSLSMEIQLRGPFSG